MSEVKEVIFTNPALSNGTNHIKRIKEMINDTPPGASIYMAINNFSDTDVADAFINAAKRGVKVTLIICGWDKKAPRNKTIKTHKEAPRNKTIKTHFALPENKHENLRTHFPYGWYGNLHTKLFLFSQTKIFLNATAEKELANYVVVAGSLTLTGESLGKQQNTIVIADNELYSGLYKHWEEMFVNFPESGSTPSVPKVLEFTTSTGIKAYFWPRESIENVKEDIKNDAVVNCIRNMSGTEKEDERKKPVLRIAMARWSGQRGISIAKALIEKARKGLKIHIVTRKGDNGTSKLIIDHLTENGGDALSNIFLYFNSVPEGDYHHKYFIYEGYYNGSGKDDWRKIVWTGSTNWNHDSLYEHDELTLKFNHKKHEKLYDVFRANHILMKTYGQRYEWK